MNHAVVTKDRWIAARKALLAREKELTHLRDQVARERRALPWVRIEKDYVFDTPEGKRRLAELFDLEESPERLRHTLPGRRYLCPHMQPTEMQSEAVLPHAQLKRCSCRSPLLSLARRTLLNSSHSSETERKPQQELQFRNVARLNFLIDLLESKLFVQQVVALQADRSAAIGQPIRNDCVQQHEIVRSGDRFAARPIKFPALLDPGD